MLTIGNQCKTTANKAFAAERKKPRPLKSRLCAGQLIINNTPPVRGCKFMTVAKITTPNNIEICYAIFGEEPNAPPIVLISGAGLQMLGWPDAFCKMLAKRGHRVIRFDNRDTGESTNLKHLPAPAPWRVALLHKLGFRISPPYTLEDMANDLVHLLDGLGV